MKRTLFLLILIILSVSVLLGQTKTGTLKIFTEINGIVLYIDDVKQDEGTKVVNNVPVGSHYLKALSNGTAIYSEIVEIKTGEVTTVLIKGVNNKVGEKPVVKPVENTGVVTYNPNPAQISPPTDETDSYVPKETEPEIVPLINIGQVKGILSPDIEHIYGFNWGLSKDQVYAFITTFQGGVLLGEGKGYSTFTMDGNTQKPYILEFRFINDKLFQTLIGYVSIDVANVKVDKFVIPLPDFNIINETLLTTYGKPTSIERTFKGGFVDGDGKEVEAIKKGQATISTEWILSNGNSVSVKILYNKAIFVLVTYTNGTLNNEAINQKVKIHNYQY